VLEAHAMIFFEIEIFFQNKNVQKIVNQEARQVRTMFYEKTRVEKNPFGIGIAFFCMIHIFCSV
jgi:hypothetical protein